MLLTANENTTRSSIWSKNNEITTNAVTQSIHYRLFQLSKLDMQPRILNLFKLLLHYLRNQNKESIYTQYKIGTPSCCLKEMCQCEKKSIARQSEGIAVESVVC